MAHSDASIALDDAFQLDRRHLILHLLKPIRRDEQPKLAWYANQLPMQIRALMKQQRHGVESLLKRRGAVIAKSRSTSGPDRLLCIQLGRPFLHCSRMTNRVY